MVPESPRKHPILLSLALGWVAVVAAAAAWDSKPLWSVLQIIQTMGPALLLSLLYFLAAWAVGRPLLIRLLPDFSRADAGSHALLSMALGWVLFQTLAVAAGLLGLFGKVPATGLLLLSIPFLRGLPRPALPQPTALQAASWTAAVLLALPLLIQVGAPPIGPDELQYHRRFVEHLIRTGGFASDPFDPPTGFAQGMHALLALPATWTGAAGMRGLALLFGASALWTGERLATRVFGQSAGAAALLVVLASATTLRVLPVMDTDLPVAFFFGAASFVALDWAQAPTQAEARPWLLALLGGAALSIKYTTPLFFGPLYLVLFFQLLLCPPSIERGRAFGSLLLASLLPAVFALPWMLLNLQSFGHPFYPILGFEVPADAAHLFRFNFGENYGTGSGLRAFLQAPYDLFITGREFDRRHYLGRLNLWPLLALPGLVPALRGNRQAKMLAAVAFLGFCLWSVVLRRVTYLLPLWPVLAAVTGGALVALVGTFPNRLRAPSSAALAAALLGVLAVEAAPTVQFHLDSVEVVSGSESEATYLERHVDDAPVLAWIREQVPPEDTLFLAWSWHVWDLPNRVLWQGAEDFSAFRAWLDPFPDEGALAEALDGQGVRWVLEREVRYFEHSYPTLSESEFERAFVRPLALVERYLSRRGTLRFSHGPYRLWSIEPEATKQGAKR